jgi:cation/acetate symporter
MTFTPTTRFINPRLGTFFGIFMSAFVAIGLLSVILEGLGVATSNLRIAMLAGPLVLYAVIGLASFTREPLDYFAAGRRVPAFYSGLVVAQTAMGATGLVALTGAFFFIGFDVLAIVIGGLAGFVVMAIMLAPFFRKFGAFTIPSYLGRRFDSRVLRILAAAVLSVPMLLMLAAELRMGAYAVSWLWQASVTATTGLLVGVLVVTLTAGGMRSLTWATVGECIASLIALMVPVAIVAIIVTNLPIPQLSAGSVVRQLVRSEAAQGLPIIIPPALAFDMPGEGLSGIVKRFSDAFASVGPLAFVIVTLTTLAGVAGAPWLLPRVAATPGVYEARKSLGWATVLFGVVMLTLGSVGIFMRDYLMDIVMASGPLRLPEWFNEMKAAGLAGLDTSGKRIDITSFRVERDAVLMGLGMAAELPSSIVHLAAAGVVAAALAAAGAVVVALGNMLGEDVICGLTWEPPADGLRLTVARAALIVIAVLGGAIALSAPTDPLKLMLWSFALTGSSAFPALVLSIWWKRMNAFGAIASILTGFSVTVLAIIAGEGGWIGLDSALAGALGIPVAIFSAIVVTLLTPAPGRHVLELVRDIRVPGGEILYDREMRQQQRRRRA